VQSIPSIPFAHLLEKVRAAIQPNLPIHLVGGAVRDLLLHREVHDLDFVLPAFALESARSVANLLDAAYYPLDPVRQTGRVVISGDGGRRTFLDFAIYRSEDLQADLRLRDFTVNAIAMEMTPPYRLVDPLGGEEDLREGRLRACAPGSFEDDPVRVLRGVRLAAELQFRILPDTLERLRRAVPLLSEPTPERSRDELVRILDGSKPATCMRTLQMLGAFPYLLPELAALSGVRQSAPHIYDVWEHTLDVLHKLANILDVLGETYDPDTSASLFAGEVSFRLGRFRRQINEHLRQEVNGGHSRRILLLLGALYHDVGKPATRQQEESGRVRFFDHDRVGAEMAASRAAALRLSNVEQERLAKLVRYHLRPILLASNAGLPSPRAIHRFFRDSGEAGVDVCLLSLADVWGTYGPTLAQDVWNRQVEVVRTLLESWWEHNEQVVNPPMLLNGDELMSELGMSPGPIVGKLLEEIREAQAAGLISDRNQAMDYARRIYPDLE
jgi:putative nucleotidyltransferase with HDIG domain